MSLIIQKHLQPNINLGKDLPKPVRPLARGLLQVRLAAVQGFKQRNHVPLVGLLSGGKARLVHAVVDLVVLPLVRLIDLLAEGLGVEFRLAVFLLDEVVELPPSQPPNRGFWYG